MEYKMKAKKRRDSNSLQRKRWPFRHRFLAMVLTLTMLLSSSGLSTLAAQAASGENSGDTSNTVTEETQKNGDSDDMITQSEENSGGDTVNKEGENIADTADSSSDSDADTETSSIGLTNDVISIQSEKYLDGNGDFDITNLMTTDSYIMVQVNGTFYTLDELEQNNLKVPKGATIFAHLEWDKITGIQEGQKLVYQIPSKMVTGVVAEDRFMFTDTTNTFAGYMSLSSSGLFTVEIDSSYFKTWTKKQQSSTLELDFLTLEFYGALSAEHGETSGGDDAKITFKGATEAEPKSEISFEIPFEYKNENSPVHVKKEGVFNAADQTITYKVTVSTPSENAMTSEDVKLTDTFDSINYLLRDNSTGNGIYQGVTATLYTNTNDGANLTNGTDISDKFALEASNIGVLDIGDMEPDSVVLLQYTVKVADDYFSNASNPAIKNNALATYNDIKTSIGINSASSEQQCQGMVKVAKSVGNMTADSDGNAYIPYTVEVTAYNGTVTGITVKDNFTYHADAIKELKDITPSTGSCTDPNNDNNLVWTIDKLTDRATATLTYKAYLDPDAWNLASVTKSGEAVQLKLTINNQADLYVDNTYYSKATATKDITKTWVNKVGKKDDKTGIVSYTLQINSDPTASDITEIHDALDSATVEGGATISYPITMKVYKSSSNKIEVNTYSLNKGDAGLTATDTSWSLNLNTFDNGKLKGQAYYYVLTYDVTNTGGLNNVGNGAGINRGTDIVYGEGTSVEVKSIDAYKRLTEMDYINGYCTWISTMNTDIDADSTYVDWLDSDNVKDYGIWWFSMDTINAVEVYQGDTLIYSQAKGINTYGISVEPYDEPSNCTQWNNSHTDPVEIPYYEYDSTFTTATPNTTKFGKVGYCGIKVMFSQAIKASKSAPVTIKYNLNICKENIYWRNRGVEGDDNVLAGTRRTSYPVSFKNCYRWTLSSGLTKQEKDGNDRTIARVYGAEDVIKGSDYDPKTGIITWKIYLNRQGDMLGDATVEDILPAGLEYVENSVELSYDLKNAQNYVGSKFDTSTNNNKDTTRKGNIKKVDGKDAVTVDKQADGTTKITVELENLVGYSFNTYTKDQATGTYTLTDTNRYNEGDSRGRESDWDRDGIVVLTLQTRVNEKLLLQGGKEDFTNNVTVTNDTMAYGFRTASRTQTVNLASKDILSKSMVNYTSGTTLTFNMDINSNGGDLVYEEKDDEGNVIKGNTLEIMDVMDSKMSLATWKDNYFEVTDGDGNSLTEATSEKISSNEYYLTQVDSTEGTAYKIIVPDGKKIHITYLVTVDAAIGENVDISNIAYFNYDGLRQASDDAKVNKNITIQNARGGTGTSADNPSFKIYKKDQWGNPVAGATFALYKVKVDSTGAAVYENGEVALDGLVGTKTTDADGFVEFKDLDEKAVYCFYETSVPTGYALSTERTYFYFTVQSNLGIASATGIDYNEKVFTVTNRFTAAGLTVPLKKTINSATQTSSNVFEFTLKQKSGETVYSDEKCTTPITSETASVTGSGTTSFDRLYFKAEGTYEFTLTENDLTEEEINEGYVKSNVEYTITAKVINGSSGLSMESATYSWTDDNGTHTGDLLRDGVPTFDNTLTLDPVTVTLEARKVLDGDIRSYKIREGEFNFEVVENGDVIAKGKTKAGTNTGAEIEFEGITYGKDDLGTHVLTIYEVDDGDFTITYSKVKFFAIVNVSTVKGQKKLQATVSYSTQYAENLDKKNGYPVFTNTYTQISTTGVPMNYLPFAIMVALAVVVGGVWMSRRRKRR